MGYYDFKGLHDKEFEALCADLLGASMSMRFERFKPGPDRGVDARCLEAGGGEVVLQCKHRPRSSIAQLIRHLKDEERPKVDALRPARYLLGLSHPLSRAEKAKIAEILHPHIKSHSDIFGAEDLNALLDQHPKVVQRHYKLWLTSAQVLSLILEKPIFDRSAFTLQEAGDAAKTFVPTSSYHEALRLLEDRGVLIVTGEPGVGKTSLAEHLALHYVADGYTFHKVADDIKEAEIVFLSGKLQFFYFDDFLGGTYLAALSGHEGSRITNFIRQVRKDPTKRFVLTSRTGILNQGKMLFDAFGHHKLERSEFELNVSAYTEIERAHILYSHLWHSNLPKDCIEEMYSDRRYRRVIEHPNFNPRLIGFITDHDRVSDRAVGTYWRYVHETLNDPANIWEHTFIAQLDDFGRALVLLVTLNEQRIGHLSLTEAYHRFLARPENRSLSGQRDFMAAIRHLAGSLLNRHLPSGSPDAAFFTLFNPSIADYVIKRHARDANLLKSAFTSLQSTASLRTLSALHRNKLIEKNVYTDIIRELLDLANSQNFAHLTVEYIASVLSAYGPLVSQDELKSPRVSQAIRFVARQKVPEDVTPIARVYELGLTSGEITGSRAIPFLREALAIASDDDEPLRQLVAVLAEIAETEPGHAEVMGEFKEAICQYVERNLNQLISESELFERADPRDAEAAADKLEEMVEEILEDYCITFNAMDRDEICAAYDLDTHAQSYMEDNQPGPRIASPRPRSAPVLRGDDIDDLFDRR
jgi:hypothetical protein